MDSQKVIEQFAHFAERLHDVKKDRDRMMAPLQFFQPIQRYRKLLAKLVQITEAGLNGRYRTSEEAAALRAKIADFFLKTRDIDSEEVNFLSIIFDVFWHAWKEITSSPKAMDTEQYEVLRDSLAIFGCLSSCACQELVAHRDLMGALVGMIKRISEEVINGSSDNHLSEELLMSALRAMHNIVRQRDDAAGPVAEQIRALGLVEAVIPIVECNKNIRKDFATLILIFAAEAYIRVKYCVDEITLKLFLVKLSGALKSKSRRCEDYSAAELLEAICKLAVIDENKKILAKLGCLQLMKSVLENYKHGGDDDEVVTLAFAILSQLAFDRDNAKWIDKEMRSLLDSKFMKSPQSELREAASTLKWTVDRGTEPVETSRARGGVRRPLSARAPPKQKHIMVSYNHASKDFVKKLVRTLEDANLGKVWVDFNDMEGDLNDAMAFAVENAWVVLVCVSLKYKDSENCKLEALYAKTRGVSIIPLKVEKWKPDGWLGLLIASALYYNFSKEDCCEETMDNLLEALREKCGRTDSMDGRAAIRATSSKPVSSEPARKPPFYSWSCADVQKWCKDNGIPGRQCANLDGRQLRMLKDMRQSEQAVFFKELQDEFKFTLKEKSAFVDALDAL